MTLSKTTSTPLSPSEVLSKCTSAITLTLSENHATFLLKQQQEDKASTTADGHQQDADDDDAADVAVAESESNPCPSLLKLTVVPTHKEILQKTTLLGSIRSDSDKANVTTAQEVYEYLEHNARDSSSKAKSSGGGDGDGAAKATTETILSFLQSLDYQLSSESGAEYSYYNASEKDPWWWLNPVSYVKWLLPWQPPEATSNSTASSYQIELIHPASERQVQRSMPIPELVLVEATREMYIKVTEPHIQKIVPTRSNRPS